MIKKSNVSLWECLPLTNSCTPQGRRDDSENSGLEKRDGDDMYTYGLREMVVPEPHSDLRVHQDPAEGKSNCKFLDQRSLTGL